MVGVLKIHDDLGGLRLFQIALACWGISSKEDFVTGLSSDESS
ncbi:unnamed protein product [Acidithrix sp. C25]|nr:unnamed protein product [Acidithrix sp. C25]